MNWVVSRKKEVRLNSPVLIEGLPGIGNVGKVAVDYLAEQLKAKKLINFSSNYMPHSVFVNENNLVEMPSIDILHASTKKGEFLFLVGDTQPIDEPSCYEFTKKLLDELVDMGCTEIITLGGIGLPSAPKKPKIYITGNDKKIVKRYMDGLPLQHKIYGLVGPIVGVTGLLVGMAKPRNIPAVALLAETFGHPMYLGLRGSKELLKVLDKRYGFKVNFKTLDNDIKEIESEMSDALPKRFKRLGMSKDVSYIG
ncbi:MAG: PAC2 family protein [Nanoarchaeota archaeon]|nr:PAC2 family protein [Nanoarchaeota archaeon]